MLRFRFCLKLFFLCCTYLGHSQSNSDCPNAVPICSDIYSFFNSPVGTGLIHEGQLQGSCLQQGETNSSWFVFTAQQTGKIGFAITTGAGQEDYDWGIWDISASGCDQVNTDVPVSCNYSGVNALTGPTGNTSQISGGGGSNPENDHVNVIAGNTYAILIDNWAGTSTGFTVDFDSYSPTSIVDTIEPRVIRARMTSCGSNRVFVRFSENVDCSSVTGGDFQITGPGGPYNVTAVSSLHCGNPLGTGNADQDFAFTLTLDHAPVDPGTYTITIAGNSIQDLCGNGNNSNQFVFSIVDADFGVINDTICPSAVVDVVNTHSTAAPCIYVKLYASVDNSNNIVQLTEGGATPWGVSSFVSGIEQKITFSNLNPSQNHVLNIITVPTGGGSRINYFVYKCANDELVLSGSVTGSSASITIPNLNYGISQYTSTCSAGITDYGNGKAQFDASQIPGPYPVNCDITYRFTDPSGCVSTKTKSVVIASPYNADFNYGGMDFCTNGINPTPVAITPGGVYSTLDTIITLDSSTGEIDATNAQPGDHWVYYIVGQSTCPTKDSVEVTFVESVGAVPIIGSPSVCPGIDSVLYWADNDDIATYNWWLSGGVFNGLTNADSAFIDWGVADSFAYVGFTGMDNRGCVIDTTIFPVIINTLLETETPNGEDTICYFDRNEVEYEILNTNGSTYLWQLSGGVIDAGDSTNSITITWDLGVGYVYISEQSTTSTSVCFGQSDTLVVQVFPSPDTTLGIIHSTPICAYSDSVLYHLNGYSSSSYQWWSDGGMMLSGNSDSLWMNWDTAGIFAISVLETTDIGCIGDTLMDTVRVHPLPTTVFAGGDIILCPSSLDSLSYEVNGLPGSTYRWSVVGGSIQGDSISNQVMIDWDLISSVKGIKVLETTMYGCIDDSVIIQVQYDQSHIDMSYVTDKLTDESEVDVFWTYVVSDTVNNWMSLFRATGNGSFVFIDSISATYPEGEYVYQDMALETGENEYHYRVEFENECNEILSTLLHNTILLSAAALPESDEAQLSWSSYKAWELADVEYEVWRSVDEGQLTYYGSLSDTQTLYLNADDGFKHCYRVNAVKGETTSWSNTVCIYFEHPVHVYNAITANGDDLNDFFYIDNIGLYPGHHVEVYNRWGNRVFASDDYQNNWDGGNLPDGNYFYLVTLPDATVLKGNLLLQR